MSATGIRNMGLEPQQEARVRLTALHRKGEVGDDRSADPVYIYSNYHL